MVTPKVSFSVAGHVSNFQYFAVTPTSTCKYKKKNVAGFAIALYVGIETCMCGREESRERDKQSQEQKWNHAQSLSCSGIICFPEVMYFFLLLKVVGLGTSVPNTLRI